MGMTRRQALAGLGALGMAASMKPLRAAGDEIIRLNIPGPHLMPFFPLELIPVLGVDRELGVRLAIRHLPSGVIAAEDMLAGNADFAGTGFPILPNFIAKHKSIVAIATLSSGAPPYAIVVRKALASKIRNLKDLRGHSVGVPMGSVFQSTPTVAMFSAKSPNPTSSPWALACSMLSDASRLTWRCHGPAWASPSRPWSLERNASSTGVFGVPFFLLTAIDTIFMANPFRSGICRKWPSN